ncbi:hypothetical protein [Spartinivicinus poritis]|uniref:Uncharacterized protein n=1 Tax=Spartinivicinus poritis TaxID=2994640 RepID=A0ABT5UD27_9GAMM|nr:hypothetical protein [Spartinivicinus sp. A2-2]MDE1463906.1 hypothetical protein [Spartinivicinus sp. A2-2]
MDKKEIQEFIACLGDERRLFYYHKDRYCFDLLRYELQRNNRSTGKLSQLKQSQFSQFFNKNTVKNALAGYGNGEISDDQLASCWLDKPLMFTLTLDCWGESDRGWDQTSRNQSNLVLQINFTGEHLDAYKRLIKPENMAYGPFENSGHPINTKGRHTMAWVRLDFDLATNEALIEEIQNDWLREANSALKRLEARRKNNPNTKPSQVWYGIGGSHEELAEYVLTALKPYQQVWSEVALAAAIQLIREELGITTIYYHTYETGKKIKDICSSPPRSMYTKLPKQFGFKQTTETPEFLMKDKVSRRYLKAIKHPEWFVMRL